MKNETAKNGFLKTVTNNRKRKLLKLLGGKVDY